MNNGNGNKATVMKFNGTAWVPVGSFGISAGVAVFTSLALYNGVPYGAYSDEKNGYNATVMKFKDAWVPVGSPGFSAGGVQYTSLIIDQGVPYVAYRDNGNGGKATVMKYDSTATAWMPVGSLGFSAGAVQYTSLAIDNGVPYVAYQDGGNSAKATVMKYNSTATAWVPVGSPGFSAGEADYTSLAIDNGVPYVAYQDGSNGNKASVMKYNGANWVPVGSPGFSAGTATTTSLAIDNGGAYVAFSDVGNNTTVMVYDTVATASLGGVYCLGATHNVSYTATGYYYSNNSFTAQLSNASGSFASPDTLGTLASTTSGTIQATIPSTTDPGTGYRIRVVASNPAVTGSDNGGDITIHAVTTFYQGKDGDGYGNTAVTQQACSQPTGYVSNSTDCNDNDATIIPAHLNSVMVKITTVTGRQMRRAFAPTAVLLLI